jgi:adenylosuccinate lyase
MPHKQNPVISGSVVLLGRLLRANAGPALEYIHCEWEDDHRQGETAWKFVPEVCLLAAAQLALTRRLLEGLVVKPENMRRNLERAGGLTGSEALLMALAEPLGRDRAHALVSELAREARGRGVSLQEEAAARPEVARHLTRPQLDQCFDPRRHLGLATFFVDRVVARRKKSGVRMRPARFP